LREVFSEHIINFDDETKGNERFDDHRELLGLTDGDLKDDFSVNGGYDLHQADKNVDEPSSLTSFGSLDVL